MSISPKVNLLIIKKIVKYEKITKVEILNYKPLIISDKIFKNKMEAVGIEPTSGTFSVKGTTCLVFALILAFQQGQRQPNRKEHPLSFADRPRHHSQLSY